MMNNYWTLIIILQIALAIHAVVTKRSLVWIILIIFFPLLGSVVYIFAEILPNMRWQPSSFIQSSSENLSRKINPTGRLERFKEEVAFSNTIKNKQLLAEEYIKCNMFDEAIKTYHDCLTGMYKNDSSLLMSLARTYFLKGDFIQSETTLENLINTAPEYRPGEVHLLLAESLEQQNKSEQADTEYKFAVKSFIGEEARCKYALFLKRQGQTEKANELFNQILVTARRSPGHVRRAQSEWIKIAKRETN